MECIDRGRFFKYNSKNTYTLDRDSVEIAVHIYL